MPVLGFRNPSKMDRGRGPANFCKKWQKTRKYERVVLHQPLIRRIFAKNGKKRENMNGSPVCLARKTQNAPIWQKTRKYERDSCMPGPKNAERP